jgi:hypothetical protein
MIIGYQKPNSTRGGVFTLPDFCLGKVSEDDANIIAERLRIDTGCEPSWQTVRSKLIQIARSKAGADVIAIHKGA